jgi:hypothetical protein
MTATNKQLLISENHGDSNRCTPCMGKSDQHGTCFPRSVRVWPRTIRISCGPHIATLRETPIDLDEFHCSREKGLPTQSTTRRLIDPRVRTQFLSRVNQWSSRRKPRSCRWPTTMLIGPINTDTDGGYSLEGAGFPHTTPRPSQPTTFTFHLSASPGLQFNQVLSTKPKCWVQRTYDHHVVFWALGHLP